MEPEAREVVPGGVADVFLLDAVVVIVVGVAFEVVVEVRVELETVEMDEAERMRV